MRRVFGGGFALGVSVAVVVTLLVPAGAGVQATESVTASFAATVANMAGKPLAGVAIALIGADGSDFRAATDPNGYFSIQIPAGEYLLHLEKTGYTMFETSLSLADGEKSEAQIEMLDLSAGQRNEAVKAYNAGAKAYEARDMPTAKQHFLAAVEADPSLAEPYLVLADIYLLEGSNEQAAAAAEKFLELRPEDRKARMLAYEAYRKLGNEKKVDALRESLGKDAELAPKLAIQVYNDGALADQKGDASIAISKFEQALGLDPNLSEAYVALGTVYYRQGQFREAQGALEKALALEPDHVQSHRLRFLVHDALGDRAAAEQAMDSYIERDREAAAGLLYKRADSDFRGGDPDLARTALLKVLELEPDMARAHYTLGLIYATSDSAKAKQHLQRFIELAPEDPSAASAKEMLSYL